MCYQGTPGSQEYKNDIVAHVQTGTPYNVPMSGANGSSPARMDQAGAPTPSVRTGVSKNTNPSLAFSSSPSTSRTSLGISGGGEIGANGLSIPT